jgi:hypothetical protein
VFADVWALADVPELLDVWLFSDVWVVLDVPELPDV